MEGIKLDDLAYCVVDFDPSLRDTDHHSATGPNTVFATEKWPVLKSDGPVVTKYKEVIAFVPIVDPMSVLLIEMFSTK